LYFRHEFWASEDAGSRTSSIGATTTKSTVVGSFALARLAEGYISAGHWARAEDVLARALSSASNGAMKAASLYQLSQVHLQQKAPVAALRAVDGALQAVGCRRRSGFSRHPELCGRAMAQEGDILLEMGKYERATKVRIVSHKRYIPDLTLSLLLWQALSSLFLHCDR